MCSTVSNDNASGRISGFGSYQEEARRTQNRYLTRKESLANAALGLCGEAGEAADIVKKYLHQGHPLDIQKLSKELGDCLWYIAEMCDQIGYPMATIAQLNIDKLRKRYPEGFNAEASINRKE